MSDLISRQAAIDAMNARFEDIKLTWRGKVKKGEIAMYLDMRGVIETLPSAEPVQHGKWIRQTDTRFGEMLNDILICSECNIAFPTVNMIRRSYCPNCGARMVTERE